MVSMKKEKDKTRPRSIRAVSVRLGVLLLALWLLCMTCITFGIMQYVFDELSEKGVDFAEYAIMVSGLEELYSDNEWAKGRLALPGSEEYCMNRAMAFSGVSIRPPSFEGHTGLPDKLTVFADEYIGCQTAILFRDAQGNIIRQSGDYMYFSYVSSVTWQNGDDEGVDGYGWIDLEDESDERYGFLRIKYKDVHSLHDFRAMRITGYFDGNRIEPLAIAILDDGAYYDALDRIAPGWDALAGDSSEMVVSEDGSSATVSVYGGSTEPPYTMGELDALGFAEWVVRFDDTAGAAPGQEPVTIYALYPEMTVYDAGGAVSYRGVEEHENLSALLETMEAHFDAGRNSIFTGASQFNLFDTFVLSAWGVWDSSDADPFLDRYPEKVWLIQTVVRASPLLISMSFLRNVYLVSLALALIGFFLLRNSIKRNLTVPLTMINDGMANGFTHIHEFVEKPTRWIEPYELIGHYRDTGDTLRKDKNELTRLNTALEYAKTAEQNRRQMTSNIAHELKTPLAIIHSHAEGLKERIAEDKREKYLDIILSESRRMDQMVLEMLDLSRLEAGKVKLSRDEFSLSKLAHDIFEKLEMAAQAKNLTITYELSGDCYVIADEARIGQVVENFATNAVKYTPANGSIRVSAHAQQGSVVFAVENDSEPLPAAALGRIWDSFYRKDESRTGSGVGLAIAKSIIDLHGGKCSARNTKTGIEFSFTIG